MKHRHCNVIVKHFTVTGEVNYRTNEWWSRSELHCVSCGHKALFSDPSGAYLCAKCGIHFHIPSWSGPVNVENDPQDKQRLAAVRAFNAKQPVPQEQAIAAKPSAQFAAHVKLCEEKDSVYIKFCEEDEADFRTWLAKGWQK